MAAAATGSLPAGTGVDFTRFVPRRDIGPKCRWKWIHPESRSPSGYENSFVEFHRKHPQGGTMRPAQAARVGAIGRRSLARATPRTT